MAIQTVGPLWAPPPLVFTTPPVFGTAGSAMNASGDKMGFVFRIPKSGNVHKIGFRVQTKTTATDTDVRLETVASQIPTGTLYGTNTNGTILAAAITSNTFVYATLTADAAVTINDLVAVSIVPTGSPNYSISGLSNVTIGQIPYVVDGSTGTYSATASPPIMAIEYSDGSYAVIPFTFPITAVNTHTFSSASNPEIIALKFKMANSPFRVSGGWLATDMGNALDVVLYDSDGSTVLQTAPLTNDGRLIAAGRSPYYFRFPSASSLLANTFYYIAIKPGASNVVIYSFDVPSAAVLDQFEGGQNFHYATNHSGVWTATTTRRPFIGLEINGIDDGTTTTTLFQIID